MFRGRASGFVSVSNYLPVVNYYAENFLLTGEGVDEAPRRK